MEEMYDFHSSSSSGYTISPENNLISPVLNHNFYSPINHFWPLSGSDDLLSSVAASVITDSVSIQTTRDDHDDDDAFGDMIKDKITSHPSYSKLLDAYIDCQKVGAPSNISCLLDDIRHENDVRKQSSTYFGVDPELDEFMETFCHILVKYKSDLTRPFDEATVFLSNIETQLHNLGKVDGVDESNISSEEDVSGGETDSTHISQELKDMLLRKFGGRISTIKQEFTKKKKKGKLPKEARQKLLQWWNSHYKWPYPTEGDKISLAESTGLDPKQINNWFINQRKRHWKPSESMQLAVIGGLPGRYLNND